MHLSIELLLLSFVLWILTILYQNRYHLRFHILRDISRIPGLSITYSLWNLWEYWGPPEYLWNKLRILIRKYPRIFKLWGANRCAVFLKHPDDIEVLLSSTSNISKSVIYSFIEFWLCSGLLVSTGDKWKIRRKLLTPAFHFNILKQFVPAIEKCSEQTVQALKSQEEEDVISIISDYTIQTICETTMGISVDVKSEEVQNYKKAIERFGVLLQVRLMQPWLWPDIIMWNTKFGSTLKHTLNTLGTFTKNVIKKRLQDWELTPQEDQDLLRKQKLPMLDLLIKEMKIGNHIDYSGICEEVDTFMFEGHDTTSMALSFLVMLLANHPEIQDKVREEQLSLFGNSKRLASFEDLQGMVYLERCIKEGLRLYPSVPLIARQLSEEIVLKDYRIPATVDVFVSIYDLHRDPEYWPEPAKFDPDRFLPENAGGRHPFSYLPFSAGPRNCIGQKFAVLEMKSFIGKLVRDYVLEAVDTPETITMRTDLVVRPANNIRVKFRERTVLDNK